MEREENPQLNLHSAQQFNRVAYAGMLLTGVILLILRDGATATIMVALALVFDPFNPQITFGKRPIWQRLWLIGHLVLVFIAFGLEITR